MAITSCSGALILKLASTPEIRSPEQDGTILPSLTAYAIVKHRDSKLGFSELLPVSVAFKTSHTALEADCPGNSGTKQEVPFTKPKLESHSLHRTDRGWQKTFLLLLKRRSGSTKGTSKLPVTNGDTGLH